MALPPPNSIELQSFVSFALFLLSALAYTFTFFYYIAHHHLCPPLTYYGCNLKFLSLPTLMLLIWLKSPQIIYHFLSAMGSWIYSTKYTFCLPRLSSFTCSTASTSAASKLSLSSSSSNTQFFSPNCLALPCKQTILNIHSLPRFLNTKK